ncbi:MAG: hypothetical protein Lokiarch_06440 [Candidatus Lokiarchaeum sp. GC14_75]|nr:MAG: hypothetical protein Lokiarch_06440 [Candidatus Lokiarchaeum sp. GC14_75]
MPKYYLIFELSVMGFTQRVLELIGVEVIETIKVKSLAKETY